MTDYNIQQIYYTGSAQCLSSVGADINGSAQLIPRNVTGSEMESYLRERAAPYQQIVLNKNSLSLSAGTPYYLKLKIPRDELHDLNFGLHLLTTDINDLDTKPYQFVRYLNIPKLESTNEYSRVILYEENRPFNGTNVKVAIAKEIEGIFNSDSENPNIGTITPNDSNTPFMPEENKIYYNIYDQRYYKKYEDGIFEFCDWGLNDSIMTHSWLGKGSNEKIEFNIIFRPEVNISYLYLYLIPEIIDNDITWLDSGIKYYGRHVQLSDIEAYIYKVNNLLPTGTTIQRFGIWGRSELMFTVDGEELKIGPSEYYELRDYPATWLGVVAQSPEDKFTIDIQY